MSAFPESGRSARQESGKTKVRFRPLAAGAAVMYLVERFYRCLRPMTLGRSALRLPRHNRNAHVQIVVALARTRPPELGRLRQAARAEHREKPPSALRLGRFSQDSA